MFVRGLRLGIVMIGAAAATQAVAGPHPAGATAPVASYIQVAGKSGAPKTLYYKNEDTTKTTATSTKVQTGVDSKGKPVFKTVVAKSSVITPKAELFTTSTASATARGATAVKFLMSVPDASPFASALSKPQDALFSLSAVSYTAPVLDGGTFEQLFSGSLSFTRTAPLYKLDAAGHAVGAGLTNLLTVNFTNALLTGSAGGQTIGLAGNTPDSTISFSSDFEAFSREDWLTNFDFAIAGNAASVAIARALTDPALTNVTGAHSLNSFRVSSTGTFASSAVPESASWMMMIMGFAAIGVARRADVRRLARVTV